MACANHPELTVESALSSSSGPGVVWQGPMTVVVKHIPPLKNSLNSPSFRSAVLTLSPNLLYFNHHSQEGAVRAAVSSMHPLYLTGVFAELTVMF